MESLAALSPAISAITLSQLSHSRYVKLKAMVNNGNQNPLLPKPAIYNASLRFQETNRPDPLFVDQYAGCFVTEGIQMDMEHHSHHHCLATKFIDDKLLSTIKTTDGAKADGMDTRPYRLGWPTSTLIFDISQRSYLEMQLMFLEGVGAKVRKGSLYIHVPWESLENSCSFYAVRVLMEIDKVYGSSRDYP